MSLVLLITHLVAFAAGSVATYVLVPRFLHRREVDGHAVLELHQHPKGDDVVDDKDKKQHRGPGWVGLAILLACAVVIAIGVQAYQANQHDKDQREGDRAYAQCLTRWGNAFAETLQKRSNQGVKLQAAEKRRDDAVDAVLQVAFEAPNPPPAQGSSQEKALQAQFRGVLGEAVTAKRHLRAVRIETKQVQAANQYVLPSVACTR